MRFILSLICGLPALAAQAEVPRVVTDIPPVAALVAQVMGDLGAPDMLLARGADEHEMQLRPSQIAALSEAQLLVWVGPELTPPLDRARLAAGENLASLALLDAPQTRRQDFAFGGEDGGSGTDPHAWLDPANAQIWLALIAAEFSRLDPEHATTYAANAEAAKAAIAAMDADLALRLAPLRARPFLTGHDAYGYFAAHYGLTYAGAVALGDASAPGAARLSALRDTLRATGAVCAFPEIGHDAAQITGIAEETGLRLGELLDPAGAELDPAPESYALLMTGIASALVACLSP